MLAIFLTSTLLLGLKYKKDDNDIIKYTVGNKMFSTASLIATIVATSYDGAGILRMVETVYIKGLWYIMVSLGSYIPLSILYIVVASRIGVFIENYIPEKNHISIADTLGRIYGRIPRIIAASANVCASATSVALSITVISRTLQTCISDVDPTILIVSSALIVVFYSAFGGIRSVTITDIFQSATFTIIILYLTYKVFHNTGMSVPQIFKTLSQSEKFQFAPILQDRTKLFSSNRLSIAFRD